MINLFEYQNKVDIQDSFEAWKGFLMKSGIAVKRILFIQKMEMTK